ncbi:M23 family metallopeptidase [Marinilabiliaceae bacterium ANBcel2]|nr:M23 family metallopeptidase [Marinilabiliaceae bacterium ANBcel2]
MSAGNSKKRKSFINKLKSKYRLAIFNEKTYEEVFVFKFSRLNLFSFTGVTVVLLVILTSILIAFTSLREYIPGYPDANQRLLIVRNAQRVDSLILEIERRDEFIGTIQTILRGDVVDSPHSPDDFDDNDNYNAMDDVEFSRSLEDSLFRRQIEREERFDIQPMTSENGNGKLESAFFFSPIEGMVINGFGEVTGHYGVDVVAAPGSRVSSVMDGIVIFSGWTVETGYVIQLQHSGNLISIYKHNETLLKDVGDIVQTGEVIAKIGNTGEYTSGPHLHFELWHNGSPLNPVDFISF